jgi:hypothetical protein
MIGESRDSILDYQATEMEGVLADLLSNAETVNTRLRRARRRSQVPISAVIGEVKFLVSDNATNRDLAGIPT